MDNSSPFGSLRDAVTRRLEQIADWLTGLQRLQLGALAVAMACLLVLQVASLLAISRDAPESPVVHVPAFSRNATATDSAGEQQGTFAIVAFKPKATAAEIAALLEKAGAEVVEGPKSGIWRIRLARETMAKTEADAILKALKSDPAIAFAALAL